MSGEIAVGTTPGGELGGTWAAPTVDTTHAGGIHAVGANPTASIGLSTINGSAATFLRSDGASPIDQNIAPTWTGVHLASAAYRNSTYLRVGSTSAPSNVTAGDFTAIRGHFGTDGAFGTNVVLESVGRVKATGTFTTTTQLDSQLYVTGTVTGNTNQFAGLGIHLDTTFNGSADTPIAFALRPTFAPSASITDAWFGSMSGFAAPPSGVTISNLAAFRAGIVFNAVSGAVSTAQGLLISSPTISGALTPVSIHGIEIKNQGAAGMTNAIGMTIRKPTGATNLFYFQFDVADATAAGAYHGRIPILYNGVLKYVHIFDA